MNGLTGVDHSLVGVRDLESARIIWRRLGFTLTPRGRHIGWGTANYCIMFEHDYIELLGIVDQTQPLNGLDRLLEVREGLLTLAFGTANAQMLHADLHEIGIAAEAPEALSRKLELPDGPVEPRFSLLHLPEAVTPGLKTFAVQHLTPELLRQPQWLAHPNSALEVTGYTLICPDTDKTCAIWRRLFPQRPANNAVNIGKAEIIFKEGDSARLSHMTIQVKNLDQVRQIFDRAKVRYSYSGNSVNVSPEAATGVGLCFVESRQGGYERYLFRH